MAGTGEHEGEEAFLAGQFGGSRKEGFFIDLPPQGDW